MPCSICSGPGHNKKTCPVGPITSAHIPPKKSKTQPKSPKKDFISLVKGPQVKGFYPEKLEHFKETRKAQFDVAVQIHEFLKCGKNVAVKAEEKSGKREIMECIHCLLNLENEFTSYSIYVTALNRKDTKVQFVEQETFGITSLVAKDWGPLLSEVVDTLRQHPDDKVFIHMDEDDYGTGERQNMSQIYNYDGVGKDRVMFIGYSATPEELEKSEGFEDDWVPVQFIPDPSYFGAKKYLERGLIRDPHTFFDGQDFTTHGSDIVQKIHQNCLTTEQEMKQRNVVVVRDVTPKNLPIINSRKSELEEKHICEVCVFDQQLGFNWGDVDSWKNLGRTIEEDDDGVPISITYKPVVIFISQTCTRSTEICPSGHRRLFAWHDARKLVKSTGTDKQSNYNTLSQAIGRVKHYTQLGKLENNILLYCDRKILEYTVEPESVIGKIKLSARVKTSVDKQSESKWQFDDGYNNPSDVPENEWRTDDPNLENTTKYIKNEDGKWCHKEQNIHPRYWGDAPSGGCTKGGHRQVLHYESSSSKRFIIREPVLVVNPLYGNDTNTFTTTKSMYL